jgi:hypothetical protein
LELCPPSASRTEIARSRRSRRNPSSGHTTINTRMISPYRPSGINGLSPTRHRPKAGGRYAPAPPRGPRPSRHLLIGRERGYAELRRIPLPRTRVHRYEPFWYRGDLHGRPETREREGRWQPYLGRPVGHPRHRHSSRLLHRKPGTRQLCWHVLRGLQSRTRGADIGECFDTASRIKEGDRDSWYEAWNKTADRMNADAEESLRGGHTDSARRAFMRASNYYRAAEFYIRDDPHDPRGLQGWQSSHD